MWKKLISNDELIVLETVTREKLAVRIEARQDRNEWAVIKRYYVPNESEFSYTQDYYKSTLEEAKDIIKHIQKDILTKAQIKKIKDLKRNVDIYLRRIYNDGNMEKWIFSVHSSKKPHHAVLNEDGSVLIRHGGTTEVNIMLKEKFRHFEEELYDIINEKLSLNNRDKDLFHNFYYYIDNSNYSLKKRKEEMVKSILIK